MSRKLTTGEFIEKAKKVHGEFEQLPNSHLQDGEVLSSERSLIAPKELDIVIPSKGIAIEFNGLYWHSEASGKDRNYHLDKTKACEAKGYQSIHMNGSVMSRIPMTVVS